MPARQTTPYAKRFLQALYTRRIPPRKLFAALKQSSYKDIRSVASVIGQRSSPFHSLFYGTPTPRDYSQLHSRLSGIYITDDLNFELPWLAATLAPYAPEINTFLDSRDKIDSAIFIADYAAATNSLDTLEAEVGVSLWSLVRRMLALELARGFEENAAHLSSLNKRKDLDPYLKLLAAYVSMRVERRVSPENYNTQVDRFLTQLSDSSLLRRHARFILDPLTSISPADFADAAVLEAGTSVVDRYLTFLNLAQRLSLYGTHHSLLELITGDLGSIRDPLLTHLVTVASDPSCILQSDLSGSTLRMLSAYTAGEYDYSRGVAADIINTNATFFPALDIYVKSSLYSGVAVDAIAPPGSLQSSLMTQLANLYGRAVDHQECLIAIRKIAYQLVPSALSYHLAALSSAEVSPGSDRHMAGLSILNTSFSTPRLADLLATEQAAVDYLAALTDYYGPCSALTFAQAIRQPPAEVDPDLSKVFPSRRLIYLARGHCARGEHHLAASQLEEARDFLSGVPNSARGIALADLLPALFGCYLHTDKLAECLRLAVDTYLQTPALAHRLPVQDLVDRISAAGLTSVYSSLDYPILYALSQTRSQSIYVAVDNFLNSCAVSRPSQLFDNAASYEPSRLSAFMFLACTMKVLARSYHFDGTASLEAERTAICRFVAEISDQYRAACLEEIALITQRSLIRRGIQQIDESRIYVDESGIRKSADVIFRENFDRLIALTRFASSTELLLLDTNAVKLYDIDSSGEPLTGKPVDVESLARADVRVVHMSHYAVMKDLCIQIRDRFISSNEYGLDSYLSVRIRHGTIENQIRSIFEGYHLLSQKLAGDYVPIAHWGARLSSLTDLERGEVQDLLARFTGQIDALVSRLNDDILQVATDDARPEALFNFSLSDGELLPIFVQHFGDQSIEYEAFLDEIFALLWDRTERNLSVIRRYIAGPLKNEAYDALTSLAGELQAGYSAATGELVAAATQCSTVLQHEFDRIARWFTLSRSAGFPDFSMTEVLQICIQSVQSAYPTYREAPNVSVVGDERLHGKHFAHFFDIFKALIVNAITHSGAGSDELHLEVAAEVGRSVIRLSVSNSLSASARARDPVELLTARRAQLHSDHASGRVRKEGGTGYVKINKILTYDLGRRNASFDFQYVGDDRIAVDLKMESDGLLL